MAVGAALVLLGVVGLAGCQRGPIDDTAGSASFAPTSPQTISPRTVEQPQGLSPERQQKIAAFIGEFQRAAPAFFASGDPQGRLAAIEAEFIATGHYLDLVGIYQNVVQIQGISSRATPRLVRAYLRLGQTSKARQLLDKLIAERPTSAMTWFLNGALWLPEVQNSQKATARVVASWQKAVELDPDFDGFENTNAPPLAEQLAALRKRTTDQAVAKAAGQLGESSASDAADEPAADEPAADEPAADEPAADKPTPAKPTSDKPAPKLAHAEQAAPAKPEAVAVTVARGDMALSAGKPEQAKTFYDQALQRDPDNVDARLGQIRAGWAADDRPPKLGQALRELAEREDLSARQKYDIGRVVHARLGDDELCVSLWTAARRQDPALAAAVDLDGRIERLTK